MGKQKTKTAGGPLAGDKKPNPRRVKKYAAAFPMRRDHTVEVNGSIDAPKLSRRVRRFAKAFPALTFDPKKPITRRQVRAWFRGIKPTRPAMTRQEMDELMTVIGDPRTRAKAPDYAVTETYQVPRVKTPYRIKLPKGGKKVTVRCNENVGV